MIIPFINQKKLITTTSAEDAKQITNTLDAKGIEYYIKTQRERGNSVMSGVTDMATIARSTSYGMGATSMGGYVYTVYVKRNDFAKAQNIIRTK